MPTPVAPAPTGVPAHVGGQARERHAGHRCELPRARPPVAESWASNRAVGAQEARDLDRFFAEDLGEKRFFAQCDRAVTRDIAHGYLILRQLIDAVGQRSTPRIEAPLHELEGCGRYVEQPDWDERWLLHQSEGESMPTSTFRGRYGAA